MLAQFNSFSTCFFEELLHLCMQSSWTSNRPSLSVELDRSFNLSWSCSQGCWRSRYGLTFLQSSQRSSCSLWTAGDLWGASSASRVPLQCCCPHLERQLGPPCLEKLAFDFVLCSCPHNPQHCPCTLRLPRLLQAAGASSKEHIIKEI